MYSWSRELSSTNSSVAFERKRTAACKLGIELVWGRGCIFHCWELLIVGCKVFGLRSLALLGSNEVGEGISCGLYLTRKSVFVHPGEVFIL